MNKITTFLVLGLVSITNAHQSKASNWSDKIEVGGFASTNYNITDDPAPFNGESGNGHDDQGSFSGTRFGLNIRAKVNDRFSFASQIFGTKEEDNYAAHVDWAFGVMKLTDDLDLRAGKLKFPVGLINEYADVGYAYPWLQGPQSFYSSMGAPNGPQITREAYTGASILWTIPKDDWTFSTNLFGGEIALEGTNVRELAGITVKADWDDQLLFQFSSYSGTMRDIVVEGNQVISEAMEGAKHQVFSFSVKADINDYLFMFEIADTEMGDLKAMSATTWYVTLGYQIDNLLPYILFENYQQGDPVDDDQQTLALGLRWDIYTDVAVKFQLSQITLDRGMGFFTEQPENDSVNMLSIGIDTVF